MRPVDLNAYLSADNPWTARLLGREPYVRARTPELVEREYDHGLYGAKLETWNDDPEGLRRFILSGGEGELQVSLGERIYLTDAPTWHGIKRQRMRAALLRFGAGEPLCELGAGFGQNLVWLGGDTYGGELSSNARTLAERMGHEIHPFDFRDPASYGFIRPGSSVFTCHAVEQLPEAGPMLEALRGVRDRIRVVIHFEPLHGRGAASLLGRLRDRYAECNDYNRDLVDRVTEAADIDVLGCERDQFGNNPLNPAGILAWRFR